MEATSPALLAAPAVPWTPHEATLARAAQLARSGSSPATIASALNREFGPRPDGRRWHARSVLAALEDLAHPERQRAATARPRTSSSSATRVLLRVLPGLVEDAGLAVQRVAHQGRLAAQADTDALTGLANRRRLEREPAPSADDSVAMLDLDHFKSVNDRLGHAVGDRVLVGFSRVMRNYLRAADGVCRLGGEAFLILMPGTTPSEAVSALNGLRERWQADRPEPVSFSAGIAAVRGGDLQSAMVAAGEALHRAKTTGRDRFELADRAPLAGAV